MGILNVRLARDQTSIMEELFAIEELAKHESPALEKQARNPHQLTMPLMEIHSKEDPVLLEDSRVLNNLIDRQAEVKSKDYFATIQTEIRPHMRKIVSDWMLEVAATCLFLASKFKETSPLPAEHLVIYTDYSISIQEIMSLEMTVLDALPWDLSAVTPYSILDHILRTVNFQPMFDPRVVRKHAETFVALAATEYSFCHQSPMVVAVACLGAALRGLNPHGLEAMLSAIHLSCGLQMEQIKQCMDLIEDSIKFSMSGMSFQPQGPMNNNVPEKMQKQQQFYSSTSTTPTDIMDVTKACVY